MNAALDGHIKGMHMYMQRSYHIHILEFPSVRLFALNFLLERATKL
jgi:hypothetical protein